MDVGRVHSIITSSLELSALKVLVGTTRPLTGREVARLAPEGSQFGIQQALDHLVAQGVVQREEAGRAALYTLNRNHLAAPALEQLTNLRSELLERTRNLIAGWEHAPHHASMFGSAARGDGDMRSDIDLFIVRPASVEEEDETWRQQIHDLAEQVHSWTGNHAGIAEIGEDELQTLRQERPAIVDDLEADGINLAGKKLREILSRL